LDSKDVEQDAHQSEARSGILIAAVFFVSICALIYELIAGTVASYLVGNSVTQFSIVIGFFLSAMGFGSFLTQFIKRDLLDKFLFIEIFVGVLGGFSALALFLWFSYQDNTLPGLILLTVSIGTLVGMEIPLILRILKDQKKSLRITVANVLTVDYIGALAASIAFPFFLMPKLGLMRTAFLFGILNVGVAWLVLVFFQKQIKERMLVVLYASVASIVLSLGFIFSTHLVTFVESKIYSDQIIYSHQSKYQRIILTKWKDDIRLFLNGQLQFSTRDEFRYHESLVHPALSVVPDPESILVLGGGDGLAVREILKYETVESITVVDLDPEITRMFKDVEQTAKLNNYSLRDSRVEIINADAMEFLKNANEFFDVIIMDLPDPGDHTLGKLYTKDFYELAGRVLSRKGAIAVQSSSPFFATDAFWCIVNTIDTTPHSYAEDSNFNVYPYHINVPSFGEWGFTLASSRTINTNEINIDVETRFLNDQEIKNAFHFAKDISWRETEINKLNDQILLEYYTEGFDQFYE